MIILVYPLTIESSHTINNLPSYSNPIELNVLIKILHFSITQISSAITRNQIHSLNEASCSYSEPQMERQWVNDEDDTSQTLINSINLQNDRLLLLSQ